MDRFTVALVGGVLLLVVAGIAAAAVMRGRDQTPDLTTPSGVVLAYTLAEQHGDAQTAWDLLATSAQARGDHERFLARAGGYDPYRNAYLSTEDEKIDGDGASVVLVQTYPGSGNLLGGGSSTTNRTTVRLVREGQAWRISVPPDDYILFKAKP